MTTFILSINNYICVNIIHKTPSHGPGLCSMIPLQKVTLSLNPGSISMPLSPSIRRYSCSAPATTGSQVASMGEPGGVGSPDTCIIIIIILWRQSTHTCGGKVYPGSDQCGSHFCILLHNTYIVHILHAADPCQPGHLVEAVVAKPVGAPEQVELVRVAHTVLA